MFERKTRDSFPFPLLILLALVAAALLFFIWKSTHRAPETEAEKPAGLWPEEWQALAREYPTFEPNLAVYENAMREAAGAESRGGWPGFGAAWRVEGPGNIGARINTIKVHPTNPNIIYVGFSRGGVWKTTDGGANWKPIFDKQTYLAIGDIELDPKNPNVVYVGTGDVNIGGYVAYGDGLWRSPDGGATWQHLGLDNQRIISKIIVHPTQAGVLFVAAMGMPFARTTDRGVYRSKDNGATWQRVLFASDQAGAIDLSMSPDNPNELFAATWDRLRSYKANLISGPNGAIWKSTDGGNTWNRLTNGLPGGRQGRIGLSQTPQNPSLLYASFVDSTSALEGIFRSTDRGASWQATGIPTNQGGGDIAGGFGWYFGKIFINPFDQNDIFVCGVVLWRSRDGGQNWEQATPDWWQYEVHADQHDMQFLNAQTFVLANDGGLYKTSDDANSWQNLENIPCTQFYRVAFNPADPDNYYGGAQDNGTSAGNSLLDEWPRLYGGDGFQAVFHPTDPNIFYYETQYGNIVGTTDGNQLHNASTGLDNADRFCWDMQFLISRTDPDAMFTGTHRAYASLGHLPNWHPISDDLTDGVPDDPRFHVITSVEDSPLDGDRLYVGTSDANVWRGSPSTQVWTNVTAGLPEYYVTSVKASLVDANRVFVTHSGYRDVDNAPHIHRSDDGGATWKSIAGDLPNLAVNDLLIYPAHHDSILFIGTDGGVFGTLNAGKTWQRLGSGMPTIAVFDLVINSATRRLVAGTHARSIMTFPLDSVDFNGALAVHLPSENGPQFAVFPSVCDQFLNVEWKNLSTASPVEIVAADLAGRVFFRKKMAGGQAAERVDTGDFPAGGCVVFAQIGGQLVGAKKVVVAH